MPVGASKQDVKRQYRKLAGQVHPDKCGLPHAEEAFKLLGKAIAQVVAAGDSHRCLSVLRTYPLPNAVPRCAVLCCAVLASLKCVALCCAASVQIEMCCAVMCCDLVSCTDLWRQTPSVQRGTEAFLVDWRNVFDMQMLCTALLCYITPARFSSDQSEPAVWHCKLG